MFLARDSIEAHLTIVFAVLAASRWVSSKQHAITADPLPGDLRRPRSDQPRQPACALS
jgi:hypothetical protein